MEQSLPNSFYDECSLEEEQQDNAEFLPFSFKVETELAGTRLDVLLFTKSERDDVSREKWKQAIREGKCLINGQPKTSPSYKVRQGEKILCELFQEESKLEGEEGKLQVLYEDEDLLLVHKEDGLTMHPCPSAPKNTFLNKVLFHYPEIKKLGGQRPGVVHRLDKDTSGIAIIAKNAECALSLSKSFADREIKKEYLAIVFGDPPSEGECHEPIGRDPKSKIKMAVLEKGREAHTFWEVLWRDPQKKCALLKVQITTGRTHQIRVHMAHCGFPLLYDTCYGNVKSLAFSLPNYAIREAQNILADYYNDTNLETHTHTQNHLLLRQMLHAHKLTFTHPKTKKELSFSSALPRDMLTVLLAASIQPKYLVLTGLPGSGKSTALNFFENMGIPTWSADASVRTLSEPGQMGWLAIRSHFGDRFFLTNEGEEGLPPLNKEALASAIVQDHRIKKDLESILHPLVQEEHKAFFASKIVEEKGMALAEIPLWPENNSHIKGSLWQRREKKKLHGKENEIFPFPVELIAIKAPAEIRHERLLNGRAWTNERSQAFDAMHLPEEKKFASCKYSVLNANKLEDFEEELRIVFKTMQEEKVKEDKEKFQSLLKKAGD